MTGIRFTNMTDLGGHAPERELLGGTMDWYRAVVARKVEGLPLLDASRTMTPTGLSPLGVVAHLAVAEVAWFAETFAGDPVEPMWEDHGSFRLRPDDTVESVLAEYNEACKRSRSVVDAATSVDALSSRKAWFRGRVSLRWILVHMIEETARHAGHLDIFREAIDGKTGD